MTFCGGHSALADGRVLFPGGNEDGVGEGHGLDKTKYFDPQTQAWQEGPTMRDGRWYPTSTTLGNGRVLISSGRMHRQMIAFGGRDSVSANSVHNSLGAVLALRREDSRLDPTGATSPPTARANHTAIHDNTNNSIFDRQVETDYPTGHRMIVFGGRNSSGTPLNDIWALKRNQESNWNWTQLSPTAWSGQTPAARYSHAAVYDSLSKMFLVGGQGSGGLLKDTWRLQLRSISTGTDTWTRISLVGADTMAARRGHSLIYQRLDNGSESRLIVFGGTNGTSFYNDVWKLKVLATQDTSWTLVTTSGTPPAKRAGHVVVYDHRAKPDRMIVFGGNNGTTLFRDVWQLTLPISGTPTWTQILPDSTQAPVPRTEAAGMFDPDYRRLIIVGGDASLSSGGELRDIWQVSLDSTQAPVWQRVTGNMSTGTRAGLTAVLDTRRVVSDTMEVFTPGVGQGSWSPLNFSKFQVLYPHMFLLPSGEIYYANLSPTYLLNPAMTSWSQPSWHSSGLSAGSSVMYRPGKVMKCGAPHGHAANDNMAYIDLTAATPAWTYIPSGLPEKRVDHNLTMLPNGKVLLSGGFKESVGDTNNAVRYPRIWNPDNFQWETADTLASEPAYREYHTTALLLPDGRILSAGGFNSSYRRMVTIYWPPYLFNAQGYLAARPQIANLDSVIVYGRGFNACLSDTMPITKVSLIKPSAVTHSFNQDQRYLELSFTSRVQGSARVLNITAPAHGNYAPPGDYMLFALNGDGVPSIARWIRLGSTLPACASTTPCYARSGNLTTQTWTKTNGPHAISGSLTIPSGVTLTIQDSTEIRFYGTDPKIIVEGTLIVSGTSTKKVSFTSGNCSPAEGDWWGIDVRSGATARVSFADLQWSEYGFFCESPDSARINNSTLSNNELYDIYAQGSATSGSNTLKFTAKYCTVNAGGSGSGIRVVKGAAAAGSLVSNTVSGLLTGTGIRVGDATIGSAAPDITSNTVSGFTNGTGISLELGSPTLIKNTVKNCKYGIECGASSPSIGTGNSTSDNFIGQSGNANTEGIRTTGSATPVIRNNWITYNVRGVTATATSAPNLGTGTGASSGRNSIYSNSEYCVQDLASGTISAQGNFWNTDECDLPTCFYGSVDYENWLCSFPLSNDVPVEAVPDLPIRALVIRGAWPNPMGQETVIKFQTGQSLERVGISIYDVSGRLVRQFDDSEYTGGIHEVTWDGRNSSGVHVQSGLYFIKMASGDLRSTAKVMVAR